LFGIFDSINEWLKELFMNGILENFGDMFAEVDSKIGEIATQVGQTPQGWNAGIFDMIRILSDTVVIPIAGIILTFVLCYELIQLIIERNNMHDFETFVFFKWIFKTFCAVYILTHTFDIVMGIFALAQNAVNQSAVTIADRFGFWTPDPMQNPMNILYAALQDMEWYEMLGLYIESGIISLAMNALSICIFIIIYGRMIEIYLTISVAPIPLSTMANREWSGIGNSYLKSLFALAFQGFLIMVCVAIYAILVKNIPNSTNIHSAIWGCLGYTVLLCFTLFKTGSLAKGLFSAH